MSLHYYSLLCIKTDNGDAKKKVLYVQRGSNPRGHLSPIDLKSSPLDHSGMHAAHCQPIWRSSIALVAYFCYIKYVFGKLRSARWKNRETELPADNTLDPLQWAFLVPSLFARIEITSAWLSTSSNSVILVSQSQIIDQLAIFIRNVLQELEVFPFPDNVVQSWNNDVHQEFIALQGSSGDFSLQTAVIILPICSHVVRGNVFGNTVIPKIPESFEVKTATLKDEKKSRH